MTERRRQGTFDGLRRAIAVGLGCGLVAVLAAGCTASRLSAPPTVTAPSGQSPASSTPPAARTAAAVGTTTAPNDATGPVAPANIHALAVGPDGTLYIADDARNEILALLPGGSFRVVAGDGSAGFSGDGGPATAAELNHPGQMVLTSNGTIYFADSANNRVRAILPDGRIETVAGSGSVEDPELSTPSPALDTDLGAVDGLALDPDGELYIAGGAQIYRLGTDGLIHWVAGNSSTSLPDCGVYCDPPNEESFAYPGQLAFDSAGDLYAFDDNTYHLLEITAAGTRVDLGNFRGDGGSGSALAPGPGGGVIGARNSGLYDIVGSTLTPVPGFTTGFLRNQPSLLGASNIFEPDAVAISPDGDIYMATNAGNSFTRASAIEEISPDGTAHILWES